MSEAPLRFPRLVGSLVITAYLLVVFVACVAVAQLATAVGRTFDLGEAWLGSSIMVGWLAIALALGVALAKLAGRPRRAITILVFVLLPCWGIVVNQHMTERCKLDCSSEPYRALAVPEVYGFLLLHLAAAAGYELSRRRERDLSVTAEPWLVALLLSGMVLHGALALQLLDLLPWLVLFPISLPLVTPWLAIILFWRELGRRLRASAARAGGAAHDALWRGIVRLPLVLGTHALLQALWRGRATAALEVFARTCTHALSGLPLELTYPQCDGHYLCTIAAQGHPAIVRPVRLGVRRGRVIVVNRQLAIANAFEDLLHERWPRVGRAARAGYDRLALPICRYLTRRWLASVVYLAMKPAEWLFYLALLAFDRSSPEARIDRMYR